MSHIPYFLRKLLPNFENFENFENFLQHLDSERKEKCGTSFCRYLSAVELVLHSDSYNLFYIVIG
jgi:hypothetical protein